MAEDLGKRLLAEIEVVGLDEIFQTLRTQTEGIRDAFGLPQLDRLIHTVIDSKPVATKANRSAPIIELTSTSPGNGKTHLICHLTALAVLPTVHGGRGACAVIIDTNGSFSVRRLAQQIRSCILKHADTDIADEHLDAKTLNALNYVHLFRPQSLPSTIATIEALPACLFSNDRHYSFERAVGLIALDSASAFYWQIKAEEDDAALLAATTEAGYKPSSAASPYAQLTAALKTATTTFCCPIVMTSWHLGPATTSSHGNSSIVRSLRPSMPAPLSRLPMLRLIAQRVPVRKFPTGISVAEAKREAGDRQRAVEEGKFECVVNEWSVDERTLQRLQQTGAGFAFRITDVGLAVSTEH